MGPILPGNRAPVKRMAATGKWGTALIVLDIRRRVAQRAPA